MLPEGRPQLIVAGHRLNADASPSDILTRRLDMALTLRDWQDWQYVLSGGNPMRGITEAAVMRLYLLEHGIPEDRITLEALSTNTFENATFTHELGCEYPLVVTSAYPRDRTARIYGHVYGYPVTVRAAPRDITDEQEACADLLEPAKLLLAYTRILTHAFTPAR